MFTTFFNACFTAFNTHSAHIFYTLSFTATFHTTTLAYTYTFVTTRYAFFYVFEEEEKGVGI
jgi:hypothetical protein